MTDHTAVTTSTIVEECQSLIESVKEDKTLDIERRVKLITALTGRQLQAGGLNLGYQRAVSRLPKESQSMVPQLNAPAAK